MAALQMLPPIQYDPFLYVLSILIAIVPSLAALWIAFQLRTETMLLAFWKKAGSALVMGAAISGMHYTAMAATIFAPNSISTVGPQDITNFWLAAAIGGFTFMFLITTLLISVFDARLANRSAKLAETLRLANVGLETRSDELSRANAQLQQEMQVRLQVENALRESQSFKDEIIKSALDGLITIDHEEKIVEFNPAAEKMFGFTREEVLGKRMIELLIPPHLRDTHRSELAHYLATGEGPMLGKRLELTAIRADGTEFPIELAVTPIGSQATPMFTGHIRDITKRKQAEDEIRRTQTFLGSI
ncbi:MAG: PAS domain S-box protein, partial [Burkholderiales bacterium]